MKREVEIERFAANVLCGVVGLVSWGLLAAGPLGFVALR